MVATASKVLVGVIDINDIVDVINRQSPRFCVILDGTVGGLFLAVAGNVRPKVFRVFDVTRKIQITSRK